MILESLQQWIASFHNNGISIIRRLLHISSVDSHLFSYPLETSSYNLLCCPSNWFLPYFYSYLHQYVLLSYTSISVIVAIVEWKKRRNGSNVNRAIIVGDEKSGKTMLLNKECVDRPINLRLP